MQLLFKAVGMLAEIYTSKFLYKRIRWLDSIMNSTDTDLSKLQEIAKDRGAWYSPWGLQESDRTKQLNNNKFFVMALNIPKRP